MIGRNTQGVRIMTLDDDDKLVGIARIPAEVAEVAEETLPDDAT
ncbi:MAG: DNA gyrase C-terminal beta-propeller domain-containing protein [Planctomycetaceae bacterium]